MSCTAIPAVYLLLERDGEILLLRRYNTGYQDGNYSVPSGHVEDGELPMAAIIREAKEEVGIEISEEDIELVNIAYRPKHDHTDNRVDFLFRAKRWSGEPFNAEPEKCDELRWVRGDELPGNITPTVRTAILDAKVGKTFSEFNVAYLKEHGLYMLNKED